MEEKFINKKVDEVMHSIDHIKRATPRPFLFTRLEAAMLNEKSIWGRLSSFMARPVVAFACICFVIVLNTMVILFSGNAVGSFASQGNELATADEYSQVSATLDEFENSRP
jgi:hypothetical protein